MWPVGGVDLESGVLVSLLVKNWIHWKTAKSYENCTQKITTINPQITTINIQQ